MIRFFMMRRSRRITHLSAYMVFAALVTVTRCHATEPPPLKSGSPEGFESIRRFFDYDRQLALEPRIVERIEQADTTREKIVFRGVRGALVPGYFEKPTGRQDGLPVVLLLHGWSGSKQSWWQDGGYLSGGNVRRSLLEQGYAVLALDAPTHGDRIAENDYGLVNQLVDDQPGRRNYFTYSDIVTQSTRDYRRAIDYLASRDEVDSERIGVMGYSMGGTQAFLLTAVEPRIRVAVSCVVPPRVADRDAVAPQQIAHAVGDRPLLMLMGRDDSMCHPSHAQQLIDMVPSKSKDLLFFDSGHKLPLDYVPHAVAYFVKHL